MSDRTHIGSGFHAAGQMKAVRLQLRSGHAQQSSTVLLVGVSDAGNVAESLGKVGRAHPSICFPASVPIF